LSQGKKVLLAWRDSFARRKFVLWKIILGQNFSPLTKNLLSAFNPSLPDKLGKTQKRATFLNANNRVAVAIYVFHRKY